MGINKKETRKCQLKVGFFILQSKIKKSRHSANQNLKDIRTIMFGKEIFSWKLNTNTEDFSNKLLRPTDEGLHAHETKSDSKKIVLKVRQHFDLMFQIEAHYAMQRNLL